MKKSVIISGLMAGVILIILCGCNEEKDYVVEAETSSANYYYSLQKTSDDYENKMDKYYYENGGNGERLYLKSDNSLVIGPVKYIYLQDLELNEIFRIIDNNGLIGYVSVDGTRITESKFVSATELKSGIALVREQGSDRFYYINSDGESLGKTYADATMYGEQFATVKPEKDSKWQLINEEQEVLYTADEINEVPEIFIHTTAVDENKSYIIGLDNGYGEVMSEFPFPKISELYYDEVAIVEDYNANKGLVSIDGQLIIPAEYKEITVLLTDAEESRFLGDRLYCLCEKHEGGYDTIYLNHNGGRLDKKVVQ